MNSEAIARVPMSDWLLAVAVLLCGAVAIVAVWRATGRPSGATGGGNLSGGPGWGTHPIIEPPSVLGPSDSPALDDVDELLWAMIEDEYRRGDRHPVPVPVSELAPLNGRRALAPGATVGSDGR